MNEMKERDKKRENTAQVCLRSLIGKYKCDTKLFFFSCRFNNRFNNVLIRRKAFDDLSLINKGMNE